jgi:hypothetical protein
VLREAYSANAKGAADYGARLIEISRENTSSALEYMRDLMGTRSASGAAHSRKKTGTRLGPEQRAFGVRAKGCQRVGQADQEELRESSGKPLLEWLKMCGCSEGMRRD